MTDWIRYTPYILVWVFRPKSNPAFQPTGIIHFSLLKSHTSLIPHVFLLYAVKWVKLKLWNKESSLSAAFPIVKPHTPTRVLLCSNSASVTFSGCTSIQAIFFQLNKSYHTEMQMLHMHVNCEWLFQCFLFQAYFVANLPVWSLLNSSDLFKIHYSWFCQ